MSLEGRFVLVGGFEPVEETHYRFFEAREREIYIYIQKEYVFQSIPTDEKQGKYTAVVVVVVEEKKENSAPRAF